jgi:acyl-coenzyme A thioesterase 13
MLLSRETFRDYLATPLSPFATVNIEGNASQELKEVPLKWYNIFRTFGKGGFGCEAGKRIVVKEVSIQPTVDDPIKMEAKLVCEIEVTAGALQRRWTWHVNKSRYV